MAKLLLTSVIRPFGGPGEGDSVGAELFHAQVTRAQGPFSLRQVIRCWAIDYLAENLLTPTVTLHYPSGDELVHELRGGDYTHVGINFVVATFHKLRQMVELVRRHAPGARIVLGGYGTVLPDQLLTPLADAICREEGVGYLRRLLGEPADRPLRHPHAPIPAIEVLGLPSRAVVGHVTAGLGCENGCDFCCTSHFFRRRYQPFATSGRDIYQALIDTRARATADGVTMNSFILIDEDFFLHHTRAQQFLEAVREGGEALSIMGFGSVRGVSRFSAREVAAMGFSVIWNAFEGKKAGYHKQKGRPLAELYRDLNGVGTSLLTSMIIGFPYQDQATVMAEFEELMSLEPSMVQCLIYFAFPGTPFHQQVTREGRYLPQYREQPDLRRWDGFSMHFEHPHFAGPAEVERLQRRLYQQDHQRLGPSVLRFARVALTGYQNLRHDRDPLLAGRAQILRRDARRVLPTIAAAVRFAPSEAARQRAVALRRAIIAATGAESAVERALSAAAPLFYLASRAAERLGVLQQPGLLRTEHRMDGAAASQHTAHVHRLQGSRRPGAWRQLAEEIARRFDPAPTPAGQLAPTAALALATAPSASSLPASLPG